MNEDTKEVMMNHIKIEKNSINIADVSTMLEDFNKAIIYGGPVSNISIRITNLRDSYELKVPIKENQIDPVEPFTFELIEPFHHIILDIESTLDDIYDSNTPDDVLKSGMCHEIAERIFLEDYNSYCFYKNNEYLQILVSQELSSRGYI